MSVTLVLGGSGSGKSEFAESLAVQGAAGGRHLAYVATMPVRDGEDERRVARHRTLRAGKGFATYENPLGLEGLSLPADSVVLVEDLSNWLANRLFAPEEPPNGDPNRATLHIRKILDAVFAPVFCSSDLILVGNDLFCDGFFYEKGTELYTDALARLHRELAGRGDHLYEVVCGIPIRQK